MPDWIVNGRRLGYPCSIALLILCGGLGGCANLGDGAVSGAFVDPAKYDLYDCPQLDAQRKSLAVRTAELGLIQKAHTGVAGAAVAEVAYRSDYITTRASAKLADETWRRNGCDAASAAQQTPAEPSPALHRGALAAPLTRPCTHKIRKLGYYDVRFSPNSGTKADIVARSERAISCH